MVIKDLALRVEEVAARDNKSRPGIYIIAMDSERLLYGYSPRFNARAAVNSLRKKGYKGKDFLGVTIPDPEKNYVFGVAA